MNGRAEKSTIESLSDRRWDWYQFDIAQVSACRCELPQLSIVRPETVRPRYGATSLLGPVYPLLFTVH